MKANRVIASALLALPLLFAAVSNAETIFEDNFDTENGNVGVLNYTGFDKWTVLGGGTVDLIGNGFFDFYPGQGLYVDLDGSNYNAGMLRTNMLALNPGSYTLEFVLGGSTRGDANVVRVGLGSLYSESFTVPSSAPLTLISRTIVVESASNANLEFQNAGGDRLGAILDSVRLSGQVAISDEPTQVPEPETLALLIAGMVGAAIVRRRRT